MTVSSPRRAVGGLARVLSNLGNTRLGMKGAPVRRHVRRSDNCLGEGWRTAWVDVWRAAQVEPTRTDVKAA
jgi:hypothetical protein